MYDLLEQFYNNTLSFNELQYYTSYYLFSLTENILVIFTEIMSSDDYTMIFTCLFLLYGLYTFLYNVCFYLLKKMCNIKTKNDKLEKLLKDKNDENEQLRIFIKNIKEENRQEVDELEFEISVLNEELEQEKQKYKLIEWQNDCLYDFLEKLKENGATIDKNIDTFEIIQNHYKYVASLSLYKDLPYLEVYRKRPPKRLSALIANNKFQSNNKEKKIL